MRFRVRRELPFGHSLLLVGSIPALGRWQPSAARPCEWTNNHLWTVHVPSPPFAAPARFEFKFCERAADGSVHWEPGHNHVALLPLNLPPRFTLDLQWARPATHRVPSAAAPNGDATVVAAAAAHYAPTAASPPPTPARSPLAHAPVSHPLSIAAARVAAHASDGSVPSPNLQSLTFRVECDVQPGESLFMLGSIPELGEWNKAHSPPMTPVATGLFELVMKLPRARLSQSFEYKYFTRRADGSRRWEKGANRVACPAEKALPHVWHQRWDLVCVQFSIYYPPPEGAVMHVTGDLPQIGAWFKPGPTRMQLGPVEMLETDVKGSKWKLDVWLEPPVPSFSYRYILVNTRTKHELWEREPNRRALFDEHAPLVNGEKQLRDVNFVAELLFDEVPPNMFIGPYPQSVDDVDKMARAGVTAVFNVQTDEDFKHRAIQWPLLLQRYAHHDIKVVRHQIRDFDRDSLRARLKSATRALERLINEGRKVYIHCTAGMGRAPACAVSYLCWVKGMKLEDAVAFVKKHRTVAVPNVPVLRDALKEPY
eukprot:TRINITY_DN272_c0_g1_i1.p1 TRINITY_DN272_c0_g1~~TRINITY_DN272_c0_g1_i1.p1  ORF type:complete len:539 (-),score=101.62 TRINITY_DN272_c0_g1_i1:1218-2834(-)